MWPIVTTSLSRQFSVLILIFNNVQIDYIAYKLSIIQKSFCSHFMIYINDDVVMAHIFSWYLKTFVNASPSTDDYREFLRHKLFIKLYI